MANLKHTSHSFFKGSSAFDKDDAINFDKFG